MINKTTTDMKATKAKTLNKIDSLKVNLIVLGCNDAADIVQELQNTNSELLEALKMVKEIWDKEEFNNWTTPIVYSKVKQAIKKAEG